MENDILMLHTNIQLLLLHNKYQLKIYSQLKTQRNLDLYSLVTYSRNSERERIQISLPKQLDNYLECLFSAQLFCAMYLEGGGRKVTTCQKRQIHKQLTDNQGRMAVSKYSRNTLWEQRKNQQYFSFKVSSYSDYCARHILVPQKIKIHDARKLKQMAGQCKQAR